jgi:hypothetical protein
MSLALSPVIGTIHIEPLADDGGRLRSADDSTLGSLLAEFAHRECLADLEPPRRLIAAGRLSRFGIGPEFSQSVVRADLARLLDDLQAEFD